MASQLADQEKQEKQDQEDQDRQEEANSLKAIAADWDGDLDDLRSMVDHITDLFNDREATETIKEVCYNLRSHPSLPHLYFVELAIPLARLSLEDGDWDAGVNLADSANEKLEWIESTSEMIYGIDDTDVRIIGLREELDDIFHDIYVYNRDVKREDSEQKTAPAEAEDKTALAEAEETEGKIASAKDEKTAPAEAKEKEDKTAEDETAPA